MAHGVTPEPPAGSEHLRDVLGDIADSYVPDPIARREMIEDLTHAINETVGARDEAAKAVVQAGQGWLGTGTPLGDALDALARAHENEGTGR